MATGGIAGVVTGVFFSDAGADVQPAAIREQTRIRTRHTIAVRDVFFIVIITRNEK